MHFAATTGTSASSSRDAVDFDTSKGKVSMDYIKFIHLTIFKPVKYVIPDISLRFSVCVLCACVCVCVYMYVYIFVAVGVVIFEAAKSLKRVSQNHAQALADLFPSSSSTAKRPHFSSAFDPTAQCLAFHRHQQKKGNVRLKPSKISFALVDNNAKESQVENTEKF